MDIRKYSLAGCSIFAGMLLSASTCLAFGSYGTTVNTYCQAKEGVQPYTGSCLLCHDAAGKSVQTAQKDQYLAGNYDYFCPAAAGCTDADGDGYALEGGTCGQVDCDDSDAAVHPGATENCTDTIDNNCNGLIDSQDPAAVGCPPVCTDADGDHFAIQGGACGAVDCNDANASVNPAVTEVCNDGIDNNCDGRIDEGCGAVCTDLDGDGYATEGGACGPVDCDDTDATVHPGAQESCTDTIDNNCNGLIDSLDPAAVGCPSTCTDRDGDRFAIEGGACGPVDCDDSNGAINPGTQEICDDGVDNDCDGAIDEGCTQTCPDGDGDGYTDSACGGADCDDRNASVNPGKAETCGNGVDENCNGMADDTCTSCPDGGKLKIKEAKYVAAGQLLHVSGSSHVNTTITLRNATTGTVLAENIKVKGGKWNVVLSIDAATAPTRVEAVNSSSCDTAKDVKIIGLPKGGKDKDKNKEKDAGEKSDDGKKKKVVVKEKAKKASAKGQSR